MGGVETVGVGAECFEAEFGAEVDGASLILSAGVVARVVVDNPPANGGEGGLEWCGL